MHINLSAEPLCLKEWRVSYHLPGSEKFNLSSAGLFQSAEQIRKDEISGQEMFCRKLLGKHPLNANCIEPLLQDNQSVPKSWKKTKNGVVCRYFFFGSVFWHLRRRTLIVLYVYWDGEAWAWDHSDLQDFLNQNDFVVVSTLK